MYFTHGSVTFWI